jgi:hypothetical protein
VGPRDDGGESRLSFIAARPERAGGVALAICGYRVGVAMDQPCIAPSHAARSSNAQP